MGVLGKLGRAHGSSRACTALTYEQHSPLDAVSCRDHPVDINEGPSTHVLILYAKAHFPGPMAALLQVVWPPGLATNFRISIAESTVYTERTIRMTRSNKSPSGLRLPELYHGASSRYREETRGAEDSGPKGTERDKT